MIASSSWPREIQHQNGRPRCRPAVRLPFNLIVTETGLREVDREWNLERDDVTIGWVLFRGLYWFLASYWPHIGSWRPAPGEWGQFIHQRFDKLGCTLSRRELLDL